MSDGKVPQFPGKPAQTGAEPAWKKAVCPFLTAGEIARTQAGVVQTLGPAQKSQVTAQACLGPACMLFASIKGPTGDHVDGCAPVHMMQMQLVQLGKISRFIDAAEAGARAEAEEAARKAAEAQPAAHAQPEPSPGPKLVEVPTPSPLTEAADAAEKPKEPTP